MNESNWGVLNLIEQQMARELATRRKALNRAKGIPNKQVSPRPPEEVELDGAGAEIFYCKTMNLYPDTDTHHYPDEDCITRLGQRVDVKMNSNEKEGLLVSEYKKLKPADVYAVVIGRFPRYRLVGHATAEEVFKDSNLGTRGHGPIFIIPQNRLHAIPY